MDDATQVEDFRELPTEQEGVLPSYTPLHHWRLSNKTVIFRVTRSTVWDRIARRRQKKNGSSRRGAVYENVHVCLPRDGNGTGRWEAIVFYGARRDYTISWWDGTERQTIPVRESVGRAVVNIFGESVGNMVGNTVGKRSREWLGTRSGTWPVDNG